MLLEAPDAPDFVLVLYCLSLVYIFLPCARSYALGGLQLCRNFFKAVFPS